MSSTPSPPVPPIAHGWTLFTAAPDDDSSPPSSSRPRAKPRLVTTRDGDRSGTVLAGQWELLRLLGKGGMGDVYEAFYRADRRRYAVKILFEEHAADPVTVERFRHEFWALSQVEHAGVVGVHAFDEDHLFYSMELLRGRGLDEVTRLRPLDPAKVVEIGIQLCESLAAAHDRGVIHRDIKPGNVMALEDGRVKVLDFGVAKLLPRFYSTSEARTPPEARLRTQAGVMLGTPGYMAPEIGLGEAPSPRHDVFSLGVTLFRLATCKMPYPELPPAVVGDAPRTAEELGASIPAVVETVLRRAMISDPNSRIQSMAALRVELEDVQAELAAEFKEIGGVAGVAPTEVQRGSPPASSVRGAGVEVGPRGVVRALPWAFSVVLAIVLIVELLAHHGPWHSGDEGRRWGPAVIAVPVQAQQSPPASEEKPEEIADPRGDATVAAPGPRGAVDEVRSEAEVTDPVAPRKKSTHRSRSLTRSEILTQTLEREAAELRRCLPGDEDEAVDLVLEIDPAGAVTSVALEGPRFPRVTQRCVDDRLRDLRFPPSGRSTSHRHRLLTPAGGSTGG